MLTLSLVLHPATFAQAPLALPQPPSEQLSRPESRSIVSLRRDMSNIAGAGETTAPRRDGQDAAKRDRNWIDRHPVLFGAMVGAGAWLVAGGTLNNELICQKR